MDCLWLGDRKTPNATVESRRSVPFSSERVDDSCGTGPCWQTLGERNLSNPHGVYRWLFTGRTT